MTPRCPGTVETLARAAAFFELDLVAHRGDGFGIGSDEDDAGLVERTGKRRALGKKAVARMHGLGAARFTCGDDIVDHQIALRGRRRPDRYRLVGHFDMERVTVGFGIDRDRFNSHPTRGLDDPAGDLAAIGNQDALEHRSLRSREPACWLCGDGVEMSMSVHIRDQCRSNIDAMSASARSAATPCQKRTGYRW